MIPIDYKITNSLFGDYHNYFSVHAQLLISGKSISQYASYSLIFSPLHSIANEEQHKNHLYNQSSHYRKYENTEC